MRQIASWGGRASRAATTTLLALTLTLAAGVGAGRSLTHIGGPPQLVDAHSYGGDLIAVLLLPLLAVLALIIYTLWPSRRRHSDDEPEQVIERPPTPWWLPWALLLIALAAVGGLTAALFVIIDRHGGQANLTSPPARPPFGPTGRTGNARGGHTAQPPGFVIHWWIVVAVIAALALVLLVMRLRNNAADDALASSADDQQVVRRVVVQSLDAVRRERDPRRAVLRAYAVMESSLGERGVARGRAETALEYLGRTLRSLRIDGNPVRRLTSLFERAKFSPHTIDEQMKQEALNALERLADDLETSQS